MLPELWPHQKESVDKVWLALQAGARRICVTTPTGGGKTRQMAELARVFLSEGKPVLLYANRRLLIEQLSRVLEELGFGHGVRAAGHAAEHGQLFQIASIQTEHSRVTVRDQYDHHHAALVLVDEAHVQTGDMFKKLAERHVREDDAAIVGYTATPIGLAEYYDQLIVAGTQSQLRACGAVVMADHYGCDEPDFRKARQTSQPLAEAIPEKERTKAMMRPGIFGRVWEHFERLNPDHKPTILFAPGVAESLWFAEQFHKKGVPVGHIDADGVWINGETFEATPEVRRQLLAESKAGGIRVLCNRYVLREGVDAPWLCHCILACVYGSLQSYLQSGGRVLRAYPGLEAVTVQDHGGNWWRHGSLNADREWQLDWSPSMYAGIRADRLRGKRCKKCRARLTGPWCSACNTINEWEPALCPQCHRVITGRHCSCGWTSKGEQRSRPVVSTTGQLKLMVGDIFAPRRVTKRIDGPRVWERYYYRARSEKWDATFHQAEGLFAHENNRDYGWPDRNWPLMPIDPIDFPRKVRDVPVTRLIPMKCKSCGAPIFWLKTQAGKKAPIDAVPSPEGNVLICGDECRIIDRKKEPLEGVPLHTNHFVTCPDREKWRKPKKGA